jgi:hypothetical protein
MEGRVGTPLALVYLALKKGWLKGLLSCGDAAGRVRFVVE